MKIFGGIRGLTQKPAAMARWFLIAHELSRLANEAEAMAGNTKQRSTHHHDLSTASLERYEQNVKKLKDVMKMNDPFLIPEDELVNIITRASMPDQVMIAMRQHESIRQELFATFVQERLVDRVVNIWSPMTKVKLQTWKTARKAKQSTTYVYSTIAALKDDRALFARFLVVILSRP